MTCVSVREKKRHDEDHEPKNPRNIQGDTGKIGMKYDSERNTISVCECE
jgi:hypothetical protein